MCVREIASYSYSKGKEKNKLMEHATGLDYLVDIV